MSAHSECLTGHLVEQKPGPATPSWGIRVNPVPSSTPPTSDSDASVASEHQIVTDHLGLARAIATRFTGRGPDRDDLFQVAYLGLVKAARRYDPHQGSFSSFAAPTVLGELKRYFRDRCWTVRPPRWVQELQIEIGPIIDAHLQEHGTSPSDEQIAAHLDTSVERVREARAARGCFTPRSFDTPVHESGRPLYETVPVAEDGYELVEDVTSLIPAYRGLDDDDRALLHMRFVEERTQQSIADELGISQMQVSRRLSRLLERLRSALLPGAA